MTVRARWFVAGVLFVCFTCVEVASAADPLDPKVKISAADQAHATAGLLTRTDLGPAWAGGPQKPNALKIPVCPAYHPDDSDLTITGHAESVLSLASSGLQIDSDVVIMKTAKQVEIQFNRILQPKLATCLRYDLLKSIGGQGIVLGKVKRLEVAKVGTHAALFRVELAVKSGKSSVVVFSDFMFLGQGRTQFYVNVVAPSSVESQLGSLENRIARTLINRVQV